MARESEDEILETVKELLRERIPAWLQLRPDEIVQSMQLLTPMHRGMLGTIQLNRELQALLNPIGEALERGGTTLRVRDKVMQLRNNYDKGVFNGDLGSIVCIDRDDGKIQVDFYDKLVEYEADELDEISLAYATSIHKSQGSEYPVVILPLHTSHYMMLYRSILYTAVTRGKKLVIVVGSRKALGDGDSQCSGGKEKYRSERKVAGRSCKRRSESSNSELNNRPRPCSLCGIAEFL